MARESTDAPGSPEQMISDFHRSHADMARRNALGLTPIASTLAIIGGTQDRAGFARIMAYPWMDAFLAEQGFAGQQRLKVMTDSAVKDMAQLFAATPVRDLQSFLMFKTLDHWAPSLSEPWVQAHFDFHSKRLQSVPKRRAAEFEKRTAGLVDQFNGYEALPGLTINGRQNLGENIGDLGGLSVAYAAYRAYVADKQGGKAPVIDGFTGEQRFFLAWSQLWRNITGEAEIRRKVLSDVHSPGEFRVNGVVRNVDAWYEAFGVKPGDKLYLPPERRVRIW
ncbi:M13-type metalloendopeptidase [Erythrobacter tepidarius]|uniref:M13-type metalloendopeptidase n=1 Tax=Erythrobacter tepidarius TaxID=60454 RepID=UPI000A360AD2|nr:M13-type metalloendopeptidase [Erythrobacter tepidarius]